MAISITTVLSVLLPALAAMVLAALLVSVMLFLRAGKRPNRPDSGAQWLRRPQGKSLI